MSPIHPDFSFFLLGSSERSRAPGTRRTHSAVIPTVPLWPNSVASSRSPGQFLGRGSSVPVTQADVAAVHTMYNDRVAGPRQTSASHLLPRSVQTSVGSNTNTDAIADLFDANVAFGHARTRFFDKSSNAIASAFTPRNLNLSTSGPVDNVTYTSGSVSRKESHKKDSKSNEKKRSNRGLTHAEWRYLTIPGSSDTLRGEIHFRPYPATIAEPNPAPASTTPAIPARAEHERPSPRPATTVPLQKSIGHIDSPAPALPLSLIEAMRPMSAPPFIATVQHRPADRMAEQGSEAPSSNADAMEADTATGTIDPSTPGQYPTTSIQHLDQQAHQHIALQPQRPPRFNGVSVGNQVLLDTTSVGSLPSRKRTLQAPTPRVALPPTVVEASLPHGFVLPAFSPYPDNQTNAAFSKRKSPDTESEDSERWKRSRGVSPESHVATPIPSRRVTPTPDAILSTAGVFIPASGETLIPTPAGLATVPNTSHPSTIRSSLNVHPLVSAGNNFAPTPAVRSPTKRTRVKRATVDLRPLTGTRLLASTMHAYILVTRKGDKYRLSVLLRDSGLVAFSNQLGATRLPAVFAPFGERDLNAYLALSRKSSLNGTGTGTELRERHGIESQSHDFYLAEGREFRVAVRLPEGRRLRLEAAWVDVDSLEGWRGIMKN